MADLKPCPFCGGEAIQQDGFVECTNIGCNAVGPDEAGCCKKWNTRAAERAGGAVDDVPADAVPVAVTRMFPLVRAAHQNPNIEPTAVTGFDVGPFFVHRGIDDAEGVRFTHADECDLWHVTHRASGFAAQKRIPTHARAIWLAQRLMSFGNWQGESRESVVAALTPEQVTQVQVLRADAVSGDCQGSMAGAWLRADGEGRDHG